MTVKRYNTGKSWPVGAKKYAITDNSAEIALKYGDTVSKGIKEMESRILELQGMVP